MSTDDRLIVLRTTDSKPEADVIRSLLEAYGVPVYVRGGDMPGVGGVTEVNRGYRIMVPAEAENDARALLASSEAPDPEDEQAD